MQVAILDYITGRVIIRTAYNDEEDSVRAICEREGVDFTECEYMVGELTIDAR